MEPDLCLELSMGDKTAEASACCAVLAEVRQQGQTIIALGLWQHQCPQANTQDPSPFRAQTIRAQQGRRPSQRGIRKCHILRAPGIRGGPCKAATDPPS